jgi:steroid delta-isomerase-like uncharacterized protein
MRDILNSISLDIAKPWWVRTDPLEKDNHMPDTANKALVRRFYEEMWNRWEFALADELLGEQIAFRGSLGMIVHGRDGFKEYMGMVRGAFPDFHNWIEDLIAESDKVVARLTYSGTHEGEILGIAGTGRRISYDGVAIFECAGGRIVHGWVLGDMHALMQQLMGQ